MENKKCRNHNFNIKRELNANYGITLISLVVTIILLIILVGVAINLSIGENGLFTKAKQAKEKYNETAAKEKLEMLLEEARIEKETNEGYNGENFLDSILTGKDISVNGNAVIVNDYNFLIDREELKIVETLGKTSVKVINEVQEYLGKGENDKYRVSSLITIESNIEIASIKITKPDGTDIALTTDKQTIATDIEMEFDQEYKVEVKTKDGKIDKRTIIEKSEEKIRNVEDLVSFRDKVNSGLTYEGKTLIVTTNLDLSSLCHKVDGTIKNDISWEPIGNKETLFKGTFDGNYNTISNLYINNNEHQMEGLFYKNLGTIQNLIIKDCNITNKNSSNNTYTGAIAGCTNGNIINCGIESGNIVASKVTGSFNEWHNVFAGGIAGESNSNISNCYNKANITATNNIMNLPNVQTGGISGRARNGIVENCYNFGIVNGSGKNYVNGGGIIGYGASVQIKNSYNIGKILGTCSTDSNLVRIAAIIGMLEDTEPKITNTYCSKLSSNISYRYKDTWTLSTVGMVNQEDIKGYSMTLGNAYMADGKKIDKNGNIIDNKDSDGNIIYINNGYPILKWQVTEK